MSFGTIWQASVVVVVVFTMYFQWWFHIGAGIAVAVPDVGLATPASVAQFPSG